MSQSGWITSCERQIPSDPTVGKQLIDTALEELGKLQWGEQDVFGVHLAFEEALVNAIKHGNRNDKSKNIDVIYNLSHTELMITIADEGEGFDPADVPDPTDEDNLEIPSGRGLMLMHSFMDTVEYNDKGNQVTMKKARTDES